jgi:hypothetical protein
LRLDRLIAGELSPAEAQSVEQHAIGCSLCGPKLEQMQGQHAAFSKVLPAAIVQRVREREGLMRRSWQLPSALAAAAAVLVWIAWPGLTPPSGVRSKGGTRLKFYVLHDGAVRPGFDGERVQPGDRLQFAYSSERDAYLAIVSIDASRKATAYYARDGRAAPIRGSSDAVLEHSTRLDETLGPETVYGLVCTQPIALEPILQTLERAPDRAPATPDCTVERYSLRKVSR